MLSVTELVNELPMSILHVFESGFISLWKRDKRSRFGKKEQSRVLILDLSLEGTRIVLEMQKYSKRSYYDSKIKRPHSQAKPHICRQIIY